MSFVLADELNILRSDLEETSERSARTIVKLGAMRITLVGLNPGGELRPHSSPGPIAVQVLDGSVRFEAEGQSWELPAGSLFTLEGGITHSVSSPAGGIFLLTLVAAAKTDSAT